MFMLFGAGSGGTIEYFDSVTRTVDILRDSSGNQVKFWGTPLTPSYVGVVYACAAAVRYKKVITMLAVVHLNRTFFTVTKK